MSERPAYLLPADPRPHHYRLHIQPDMENFTFEGTADISLKATGQVGRIELHAWELAFQEITLQVCGTGQTHSVACADVVFDEVEMRAAFPLPVSFTGEAVLHIGYTGCINDKLKGFTRSRCTVGGKEAYIGYTQFEAVGARLAFPCWDEPEAKAVFEVAITARGEDTVLCNMPSTCREAVGEGLTRWTFAPTPIMSTYLLAWAIGRLECSERSVSKRGAVAEGESASTIVRVFTPEGQLDRAAFALQVACDVLPLYEDLFGINYPLPKMDMIALADFDAGAMENWGLITYRESCFLCTEESSLSSKKMVCMVVAHEIAHQWFGNLVTMRWWDELWLNEAFATYMQHWATGKLFPEWNIDLSFLTDAIVSGLQLDALRSSHPVQVPITKSRAISELFDAISYRKGGAVVRMAIEFIGEEAFQRGISAYLRQFMYGNASTADLWDHLGRAAGRDLVSVLGLWTSQQGFPYLTVRSCGGGAELQMEQRRFLLTGDPQAGEEGEALNVPLVVLTPERGPEAQLVSGRSATVRVAHPSWVVVNHKRAAFCRVLYRDAGMVEALLCAVERKELVPQDRLTLVADYHAFAMAGHCAAADVLRMVLRYRDEEDYAVWVTIAEFEGSVRALLAGQDAATMERMDRFACALYGGAMGRVGLEARPTDTEAQKQLRGLLFRRLTCAGEERVMQHARALYANRAASPIPADLFYAVLAVRVREGGADAIREVQELGASTVDEVQKIECLAALGNTRVADGAAQLLQYGLSDQVASSSLSSLCVSISGGQTTRHSYVRAVIPLLPRILERVPLLRRSHIGSSFRNLLSEVDIAAVEACWKEIPKVLRDGATSAYHSALESARITIAWIARDVSGLVTYLQESY